MLSDQEGKPRSPGRHKDESILLGLGGVDEARSELFKQNQNLKKGGPSPPSTCLGKASTEGPKSWMSVLGSGQ